MSAVRLQRYDESEAFYRQTLVIFERTFGPEVANLHKTGEVLCVRGGLEPAEQLYRRALTIKAKLLGVESPDAAHQALFQQAAEADSHDALQPARGGAQRHGAGQTESPRCQPRNSPTAR